MYFKVGLRDLSEKELDADKKVVREWTHYIVQAS